MTTTTTYISRDERTMQPNNNTTYTDRNDQRPNLGGWMHQHWPRLSTFETDPNDGQSVRGSTKTAKTGVGRYDLKMENPKRGANRKRL